MIVTTATSSRAPLIRCNRQRPCEICGRWKFCSYNERIFICTKVASDHPTKDGSGWIHFRSEPIDRSRIIAVPEPATRHDLDLLHRRYQTAVNPTRLQALSARLGVTTGSLNRLGIGWHSSAWSFPMVDAAGQIVGIRLRNDQGEKWSVKGGHEGLFVPADLPAGAEPLLICEGPTDTAAALDMGFAAIGRPSCTGAVKIIVQLCRQRQQQAVVIVADADEPGQRGAAALASVLRLYVPAVKIIAPPNGAKDIRAWRNTGATAADVQSAIAAANPIRFVVRCSTQGASL